MKTLHTPGNWYAKDGQVYPEETGKTLALIPYFDKEDKEQEANSRLIAAAPELLDTLQSISDTLHQMKRDQTVSGMIYIAEMTIRKATQA